MYKRIILLLLTIMIALAPAATWAHHDGPEADKSLFNSEHYDFVKYSKMGKMLKKLQKKSNRVTVKPYGMSAGGHPMYVVTISEPGAKPKFNQYQQMRRQMFKHSMKAQRLIGKDADFKVPILINGSIHGTEFVGSDAVLRLMERFATQNDPKTKSILNNNILIFNVVANPDGRWSATRFNANGFDLNRDFITRSQPETRQMVELITRWNPMVMLDLHGYVQYGGKAKPGLIEPCTPPHNPNYEYDLFSKWALDQAKAMETYLVNNRDAYQSDLYRNMTGTFIPQRDDTDGWDDYPPIFTPMYAMYHGSYAYTLEAPTNDWDGVRWQEDAVMGALTFATEHKDEMLRDQLEMFRRGIQFDHPYHKEGFFPKAYILPVDPKRPTPTFKAVNHLIANDITVEQAKKPFQAEGKTYPAGTFIVRMNQAKAGLANTMLWEGEDITDTIPSMYDISSWSLPKLWGFQADRIDQDIAVTSGPVKKGKPQGALSRKGPYHIPNQTVEAVYLVNTLLKHGIPVWRDSKGDFYVHRIKRSMLKQAVRASGLRIRSRAIPKQAQPLRNLKVAILKDGGIYKAQSHAGTREALERLGFQVTELHPRQVAKQGLGAYDVFVYSGTSLMITSRLSKANKEFGLKDEVQVRKFKKQVTQFVKKGGKYIAVGSSASQATRTLGLTDITVHAGGGNSNGIVKVDTKKSPLTFGYAKQDIGFVYRPAWYTPTHGETVAASYKDSPDFFHSGHWKNRQPAQGKPVIVQEKGKDVTLIGLEPGFRGHTDYLYRLLSNAVWE
ncbi:M14 family zinc carboxypeptidase [Salinithrix halophila]|uniref:M14 family zinc carboxypeptidase n=1 Tax=Salinithrix halophila TaxID=1485204 RepID=A0ABV8JG00_9BACL